MEKARTELGRDLAHALRTGPFSVALHLAIEDRGLRLEEIQQRLSTAGPTKIVSEYRLGGPTSMRPFSGAAYWLA